MKVKIKYIIFGRDGPLDDYKPFRVWLRRRLEQILSHSEKSCIAAYYKQFSTDFKINHKMGGGGLMQPYRNQCANGT